MKTRNDFTDRSNAVVWPSDDGTANHVSEQSLCGFWNRVAPSLQIHSLRSSLPKMELAMRV